MNTRPAWDTLHQAILLARSRERAQRGRVDAFIHFVTIELADERVTANAKAYCKSLGISVCSLSATSLEIHALPMGPVPGVEDSPLDPISLAKQHARQQADMRAFNKLINEPNDEENDCMED